MKRIGLIGGMSWESTRLYYGALNGLVRERRGGLHSADVLIHSLDFAPIAQMQADGDWAGAGDVLARSAQALERGGANVIGLATNTMHKVADAITAATSLPFIHIADATCGALIASGKSRPLLLATAFTMEQDFYVGRLKARGLDVQVPDASSRAEIHRIIYEELCCGAVNQASRAAYIELTAKGAREGCDAVILGCTEVGMLLNEANSALPTFDTMLIHARALIDFALDDAN